MDAEGSSVRIKSVRIKSDKVIEHSYAYPVITYTVTESVTESVTSVTASVTNVTESVTNVTDECNSMESVTKT